MERQTYGALARRPLVRNRPHRGGESTMWAPRTTPLRESRLFPGTRLAHADLHNHSLLSDGRGDPEVAFRSMRAAGLDIAALTEHTRMASAFEGGGYVDRPQSLGPLIGIDQGRWDILGELADGAGEDGRFVAIRGFEWSSPSLGHVNVWFSDGWTDPFRTGGMAPSDAGTPPLREGLSRLRPALRHRLLQAIERAPAGPPAMAGLFDWLAEGSGPAAMGGFNHPGRDSGMFAHFALDPAALSRMVSIEAFNRSDDYLFEGIDRGAGSPINRCLNQGWRVGLAGVTDEHGSEWGFQEGQGRTGLWVSDLSRSGVRRALFSRRFFAAKVPGLALDASLDGWPMGGTAPLRPGWVRFQVDLDRGPSWTGKLLSIQVLGPGSCLPTVLEAFFVRLTGRAAKPLRFELRLDPEAVPWLLVRVSDPELPADPRAPAPFDALGAAIAYGSPFFVVPQWAGST